MLDAAPLPQAGREADAALVRANLRWLRVIGMLVVFAIHAAEPFNPWDTWHVASARQSKWLGELVFFPAPWIMPLFMVLAGESAWHALGSRSGREYLRERLLRIGVPLAAGVLLLVPPQVYLERRLRGEIRGSLLEFYPRFFEGIYPRGNLSWHHLWFLVFLLAFAVVTLPLFRWLRSPPGRRLMAGLAERCDGPGGLAWILLPAAALRVSIGLLFPGIPALAHDWSNRGLLLPAFVAGFVFAGEPRLRRAVDRRWRRALALALAVSAALAVWAWPGHVLDRLPHPRSVEGGLLWGGYACGAAAWIVALLGAARRHLRRTGPVLERASEMAYPFYVLHHGIVIAAAYVVVQRDWPVVTQFLAVTATSLLATIALCAIVATSGALRVLFGLRARRPERLP